MEYGICNLGIVPVRNEPSDKSEMTSQLLFGDFVKINEKYKVWIKVVSVFDGYEGWIDSKQLENVSDEYYLENLTRKNLILKSCANIVDVDNNLIIKAVLGSSLPCSEGESFIINKNRYRFDKESIYLGDHSIEQIAAMYLNAPYLWGGRSPYGIDCSGFTQLIYKIYGVCLKRDASQQAEQGTQLDFLTEALPGDLAFFENEDGKIIHVGLILDENKIMHASGRVKIDTIDHEGIFSNDFKRYTHKLRFIKRMIF
jgi:hypothetical protein